MVFKKGDPDICAGRERGVVNKSTLALQAEFRAAVAPKLKKYLAIVDEMTNDLRKGEPCPYCGKGMPRMDSDKLSAVKALWDRSGLHPRVEVEITEQPDVAWMQYLSDEQLDKLSSWIDEARKQIPNEAPLQLMEAEVVAQ